jgi:CRP-like cAMP-binding protein
MDLFNRYWGILMDSKTIGGQILCYEDGKVIFEEDSIGKELYIIESGNIEICRRINGKNITIHILKKGDIFGESAMFEDTTRKVTAISIGRTLLISMSIEELIYRVQNNLDFAIELMQSLIHRLHNTDIVVKNLISKIYSFSDGLIQEIFPEKRATKLGEILIEMGYITPSQLDRCLQKQKEIHIFNYKHKLIGEIIIEMGMITENELKMALSEQKMRIRNIQ